MESGRAQEVVLDGVEPAAPVRGRRRPRRRRQQLLSVVAAASAAASAAGRAEVRVRRRGVWRPCRRLRRVVHGGPPAENREARWLRQSGRSSDKFDIVPNERKF